MNPIIKISERVEDITNILSNDNDLDIEIILSLKKEIDGMKDTLLEIKESQ